MPNATEAALSGLRKRDLHRFLETDPRVREWLKAELVSTKEAAEIIGVERPRIWRWENATPPRITQVAKTAATPIYLRSDCLAAKAEEDRRVAEREARQSEATEA